MNRNPRIDPQTTSTMRSSNTQSADALVPDLFTNQTQSSTQSSAITENRGIAQDSEPATTSIKSKPCDISPPILDHPLWHQTNISLRASLLATDDTSQLRREARVHRAFHDTVKIATHCFQEGVCDRMINGRGVVECEDQEYKSSQGQEVHRHDYRSWYGKRE